MFGDRGDQINLPIPSPAPLCLRSISYLRFLPWPHYWPQHSLAAAPLLPPDHIGLICDPNLLIPSPLRIFHRK